MTKNSFRFSRRLPVWAASSLDRPLMLELWQGFCLRCGSLEIHPGEVNCLCAGDAQPVELPEDAEYIIRVTETGLFLRGRDADALARGTLVLMMQIQPLCLDEGREAFQIACGRLEGRYTVARRMIHFCIFPETSYPFIKKCIRLAGVMQYTHVVLEFWGMLRYDCMKELAWDNAFSKEQVRELVQEIETMGMQAVPMFNHLGHASACRVSGGKHVVLDQNPKLAMFFSPDGWSWNITDGRAFELLARVRQELYELFPHCSYFHLGCDEVYSYESGKDSQRLMRDWLVKITRAVHEEGRTPILWADMLLHRQTVGVGPEYYCNAETAESARMLLDAIPRYTLLGDWHYDVLSGPIRTSLYLKEQGFRVLEVPWFEFDNGRACVETVQEAQLEGVMVSTWHTLAQKMAHIVYDAQLCGAHRSPWAGSRLNQLETETATLLRKLYFVNGDYEQAGWTDRQVFLQSRPMV